MKHAQAHLDDLNEVEEEVTADLLSGNALDNFSSDDADDDAGEEGEAGREEAVSSDDEVCTG